MSLIERVGTSSRTAEMDDVDRQAYFITTLLRSGAVYTPVTVVIQKKGGHDNYTKSLIPIRPSMKLVGKHIEKDRSV